MNGQDFGADWSAAFRRGSDAELRGWLDVAQAFAGPPGPGREPQAEAR